MELTPEPGAGSETTSSSLSRRDFFRFLTVAAGASFLGCEGRAADDAVDGAGLHRWFPRFPVPRELWVVPFVGDAEEGMVLESVAGLAGLEAIEGRGDTLVYEDLQNDGYQRWVAAYCREHQPVLARMSLDEAVERLVRAGVIRGYILFRFERSTRPLHSAGELDESANVATALAATERALVVSERLAGRLEQLRLKRLLDVRDRTEAWCLTQRDFSRRVLGIADPKTRHARSLMIALHAFVCCGRGDTYDRALRRCDADVPVLGWGCEAEDRLTVPSSRWGLFQTATNWCHNLPVFAADTAGHTVPASELRQRHALHWSALDWGEDQHYVNFTLSDGDNVQWVMGNFTGGGEATSYYGNPHRGRVPLAWGLPVTSLCQVSPRTLAEILAKATPQDDFIQYNGGGYFYPDLYGRARGDTRALELHAERLRAYMDLTGIRILAFNFQDWDSPEAMAACAQFGAKLPGLLGILAFQYFPYPAGEGAIRWVQGVGGDQVPVVSCRLCLWANTGRARETTPAGVAAWLNRLPVAGTVATPDCFSWVIAHAWSRFRHPEAGGEPEAKDHRAAESKPGPDTARGYDPVRWTIERLEPTVKPVTAQELLCRVRLRLRPRATLERWLTEVEAEPHHGRSGETTAANLAEARALLERVARDVGAPRRCFELLRRMYRD